MTIYVESAKVNTIYSGAQEVVKAYQNGQVIYLKTDALPVSDLMSAYNFNEASGPVIDHSGNGRNVTVTAGQRVASPTQEGLGAAAGGMTLAGKTSGVDIGPYNATTSRSMTFWTYLTGSGVWTVRWQDQDTDTGVFGIYYISGTLRARFRKGLGSFNADSVQAMPTSTWVHLGVTYDAATGAGRFYRNGVLVASTTVTAGGLLDPADFIDVAADSGNGFVIDNCVIYSKALTLEEVVRDMNTPVT